MGKAYPPHQIDTLHRNAALRPTATRIGRARAPGRNTAHPLRWIGIAPAASCHIATWRMSRYRFSALRSWESYRRRRGFVKRSSRTASSSIKLKTGVLVPLAAAKSIDENPPLHVSMLT
jgi:hypothetical protein